MKIEAHCKTVLQNVGNGKGSGTHFKIKTMRLIYFTNKFHLQDTTTPYRYNFFLIEFRSVVNQATVVGFRSRIVVGLCRAITYYAERKSRHEAWSMSLMSLTALALEISSIALRPFSLHIFVAFYDPSGAKCITQGLQSFCIHE